MNENAKETKKQLIYIICGVVFIAIILGVSLYFTSFNNKNSQMEEEIQEKTQVIAEKFAVISAEILESDGKTVKSDYSQTVKDAYAVFQSKVAEMGEIIDSKDSDPNLTAEEYYQKLSTVVSEVEEIITALDGELHLQKTHFQTVFTELKLAFDTISEKMVSGDGIHLIDQYKDYQADFDSIRENVLSLATDLDGDDTTQEFYDNLAKKGEGIMEKIRELAKKVNIEI